MVENLITLFLLFLEYTIVPLALFIIVFVQNRFLKNQQIIFSKHDDIYLRGLEFMSLLWAATVSFVIHAYEASDFVFFHSVIFCVELCLILIVLYRMNFHSNDSFNFIILPNILAYVFLIILIAMILLHWKFHTSFIKLVGIYSVINIYIFVGVISTLYVVVTLLIGLKLYSDLKKISCGDFETIQNLALECYDNCDWKTAISNFKLVIKYSNELGYIIEANECIAKCYKMIGERSAYKKSIKHYIYAILIYDKSNHYPKINELSAELDIVLHELKLSTLCKKWILRDLRKARNEKIINRILF